MKTRRIYKIVAMTLLIAIVNEIIFPTISFALTSMDTQPEVWSYQPVDATDNVSLLSGKFNYTIPITSIPEYPMAIGYSSGMGMEQEGGMFGYGFSGFSGAIARNVMGLPDDINGGARLYAYSNQIKKDYSFKQSLSISAGKLIGIGPIDAGSAVSASLTLGYNNYTGAYGAVGIGFGQAEVLNQPFFNLTEAHGVSLISDSRESGVRIGVGSITSTSYGYGAFSHSEVISGDVRSKIIGKNNKWTEEKYINGFGKSFFPNPTSSSVTSLAPLSYVLPSLTGYGLSSSVTNPLSLTTYTGAYSELNYGNTAIPKKAYGFLYLNNYKRENTGNLADMTIEGEDPFNPNSLSAPSYLQRDFFSVNAMGISGSMQLHQKEYGVVSRNKYTNLYNDVKDLDVTTYKKEIKPWVNVVKTKYNSSIDIIAMLKKKPKNQPDDQSGNHDGELFYEEQAASLTGSENEFGNSVFKMRGDLAGEFNLSSKENFKNNKPNQYDFDIVVGSGFKDVFLYTPKAKKEVQDYYDKAENGTEKIVKSTNIKYRTIGQMLTDNTSLLTDLSGSTTDPDKISNPFNFRQSFYSHYEYDNSAVPQNTIPTISKGNNVKDMNILTQMKNLMTNNTSLGSTIGSIEVQNTGGVRYFFNLPVYNKTSKSMQLAGNGENPPISSIANDNYHSLTENSAPINRKKFVTIDNNAYPYAWLLTAIVGDDYIDFDNIPGPSDGDIGYWVKFKYTKVCNDYRWRNPFVGMNHFPFAINDYADDMYSMTTGTKEVYLLSEIESANYRCNYTLQQRYDALDAAGEWNGNAANSLKANADYGTDRNGSNFQFLVTQIDLYKKHSSGNNSQEMSGNKEVLIKSTVFQYDYSMCQGVPNNYLKYNSVSSIPYYYGNYANATNLTGKATLRKVQHIAYDENGNPTYLPSYEFKYWGDSDSKYNPPYDKDQYDQWGNYCKNAKVQGENGKYYYTHYTELDKADADENARVYNMMEILLPSGGSMHIDYQAQTYGYIENQKANVMRHVTAIRGNYPASVTIDGILRKTSTLTIDISDLEAAKDLISAGILYPGKPIYGEIAFYQVTNATPLDESQIYMAPLDVIVNSIDPLTTTDAATGKRYQDVTVFNPKLPPMTPTPFIGECKNYMYTESIYMRALKEKVIPGSCPTTPDIAKYKNMEKDNAVDAVIKIVTNVRNVLIDVNNVFESEFNGCYGTPGTKIFSQWSYLSTPVYKSKYTGSSVSTLTLTDDFQYGTNPANGTPFVRENQYGTRYFYDENSDGTGVSAGVATIEPGGGRSCVIDVTRLTGAGFAPSPIIYSSKTTLKNLYKADNPSAAAGTKVSRKKGATVYEFYTPKDNKMQFSRFFDQSGLTNQYSNYKFHIFGISSYFKIKFNFFGSREIKIPVWMPITINWLRNDKYCLKSYTYIDNTDIYGRPKSILQMAEGEDKPIGKKSFEYYGWNDDVPVYQGSFNASMNMTPGKMDQTWSEAYYTKETQIKMDPISLNANTDRNFCYTNMKYSYVPPILKKVNSSLDGLETSSENTGFDYYTGSAIEVRSKDSYNNTKIARTVPAYWEYTGMGPSWDDDTKVNNLNATTGTYMYLNQVDRNHLLGVGIVEWSSNTESTWDIADYLHSKKQYIDASTYKYVYDVLGNKTIKDEYASAKMENDGKIKRNAVLYKAYKGYTYETELNADGTFKSYTTTADFKYPHGAGNVSNWKLLSTNQLYSANGVLLQSKDVLNKYAAQLLGYNFSNTIGTVSNASWAASVYDGAENTYVTPDGKTTMLEGNKLKLGDAEVIATCDKTYLDKTLDVTSFPAPIISSSDILRKNGNVINIKHTTSPVYNVPFAKFSVVYKNTNIARTFYISIKENGEYQVLTNLGENFTGFLVYPKLDDGSTDLIFTPSDFTTFNYDASFPPQGFTVTYANKDHKICSTRPYQVPANDCISEAHTGRYAFKLKGGNATGTRFSLSSLTVTQDEFNRKYKALVWVHNSSPKETELVMQRKDSKGTLLSSEVVTSMATPYAKAGNWSLLRIDFDLTNATYSSKSNLTDYVDVFVRNGSQAGIAIYDDMRVLPYHADMTNWVFDHKFNRVVSGLDNDNFASFSNYDARGRVIESAVEVQDKGKSTVQKFLYNDQKKN